MKKFWQTVSVVTLLFAVLMCSACGVKVTFDIGDATLVSGELTQKYQDDSPIVAPEVEKEGYVFAGWDNDFSAPTEEMTVKPLWKKIHTVTFALNGGTATDTALLSQKVVDGEGAKAPEISREGYVFDAWDADFSVITGDLTVTAQWKKLHTVTFELLGGITNDPSLLTQYIVDGEAASLPITTREKYNFVKWDTDVSAVTEDLNVKAIWERKSFSSTEIFNLINPGTVEIKTYRLHDVYYGMGSGFFIDEDGLLLTNYHVIENARAYTVTLSNGRTYKVSRVVGYDIEKDIAILKVDTKGNKVPYLEIGTELPEVGDAVYAIGSSLGLTGTFSSGIVSFVDRTIKDIPGVSFIQTTTPISAGNSGGPLVDEHGYVVGINSGSYTAGQNLNLAIEISQYLDLKEVNLTPEELFQKEGTLKYYFGEVIVKETEKSYTTGQLIENGSTVHSTITGESDEDYYMVKTPDTEGFLLLMITADSEAGLEDIEYYYTPFYTKKPNVDDADSYVFPSYYYYGMMIEETDGTTYYLAMVLIDENVIEESNYIGVAIYADREVNYEMFMYTLTEENLEIFT